MTGVQTCALPILNPQLAQTLQAAMSAHINEHLGMEYKKQLEQIMGRPLPDFDEDNNDMEMPPEMEFHVSQMAAQAAQQLLAQHQQESQQAKAQQQMQDPIIQMQQQELAIKQQDAQRKAAKDQADFVLKQQAQQIERERIAAQQETEGAKLALKATTDNQRAQENQETEGFRLGMEMRKQHMAQTHQRGMAERQQPKKDNK